MSLLLLLRSAAAGAITGTGDLAALAASITGSGSMTAAAPAPDVTPVPVPLAEEASTEYVGGAAVSWIGGASGWTWVHIAKPAPKRQREPEPAPSAIPVSLPAISAVQGQGGCSGVCGTIAAQGDMSDDAMALW